MEKPELNIVEAVIRNIKNCLFHLDAGQLERFLVWLESHTKSKVAENGKLTVHFTSWLESLSKQRVLDEGFLITSEIFWFKYRGEFDNNYDDRIKSNLKGKRND